jgi:hypothetical protein
MKKQKLKNQKNFNFNKGKTIFIIVSFIILFFLITKINTKTYFSSKSKAASRESLNINSGKKGIMQDKFNKNYDALALLSLSCQNKFLKKNEDGKYFSGFFKGNIDFTQIYASGSCPEETSSFDLVFEIPRKTGFNPFSWKFFCCVKNDYFKKLGDRFCSEYPYIGFTTGEGKNSMTSIPATCQEKCPDERTVHKSYDLNNHVISKEELHCSLRPGILSTKTGVCCFR